jgi:predicted O-methyltransferase YrrM
MMPLTRIYNEDLGKPITTVYQGYLDRLTRWSDIQEFLPLLYDAARSYPEVRVLELGARSGNSTLALLAGAIEAGGHVTSCDIDKVTNRRSIFNGLGAWTATPEWTFIHGDDMDPKVQDRLPQEVDVLFLDTSHYYEHTLAELESYVPRVVPGGVVLCHDTLWLPCRPGEHWDGSPPPTGRAIDDYCKQTGRTWTEIPVRYGMGIIHI